MARGNADHYKQILLIDRISTRLGVEQLWNWLAERSAILSKIPHWYLLVVPALLIDMVVLDIVNQVTGRNTVVDDPGKVFITIGIVLAAVGVHWMQNTYAKAVADLQLSERNIDRSEYVDKQFKDIVPFNLRILVYLSAIVFYYANWVTGTGIQGTIEIEGFARAIYGNFLFFPLVVFPLMVDFGLLYLSIHILLPRRIAQADLDLFFYDPQNMGGFRSVGQLLKRSYYLYTAGLLLFFAMSYWPLLLRNLNIQTPYPGPDTVTAIFFTILWVIGICSIGYSMYRMHTLMSRKKQEAIRNIENDIKQHLEDPFDITTDHLEDPELRAEFEHKIREIRSTKRYPTTFTMWTQILISVLLPQAMQIALRILP